MRPVSSVSYFQLRPILHPRHRGKHLGVASELGLQGREFFAEGLALSGLLEGSLFGEAMPAGGEGADDLVQDDDGQLGELGTASAVAFDDFASERLSGKDVTVLKGLVACSPLHQNGYSTNSRENVLSWRICPPAAVGATACEVMC